MAISIYSLRPKDKTGELTDRLISGPFESIEYLFNNLETIVEEIPPEERYNLYYTAASCKGKEKGGRGRQLLSQEIIPFDIDKIDYDRKEEYVKIACNVLGVDPAKCIIVYSGNGVQIIIKIKDPITDPIYFDQARSNYARTCRMIEHHLKAHRLPFEQIDQSVFKNTALLRLPHTLNIKPLNRCHSPEAIVKEAVLANRNLEYHGFIPPAADATATTAARRDGPGDYPPTNVPAVMQGCEFIKSCLDGSLDVHDEDAYMFFGVVGNCGDPNLLNQAIEQFKKSSDTYRHASDSTIQSKLMRSSKYGRTCASIYAKYPEICSKCVHNNKIASPAQIGRKEVLKQLPPGAPGKKIMESQALDRIKNKLHISLNPDDSFYAQEDGNIYRFDGRIWVQLTEFDINEIKREIESIYGVWATYSNTEAIYRSLARHIPGPPPGKSLIRPATDRIAFANGTLYLLRNLKDENYILHFSPQHKRRDYMTNIIDLPYDNECKEHNEEFDKLLDRLFDNCIDKDDKIAALSEMFGAAIMPTFPHLFMLFGPSGAGKSTICKLLSHLLTPENMSSISPNQFEGFLMEPMIGKLVNMVTDIDYRKPINDDIVKQIEDRKVMTINRKNRLAIQAPLPAVHIFGTNQPPATYDGIHKTHGRRWTFLEFNNVQIVNGVYHRAYPEIVWEHGAQGILNFAIKGLKRLIERKGIFTNPLSGKNALKDWENEHDVLALFLDDIESDGEEYSLALDEKGSISKRAIWEKFEIWKGENGRENMRLPRNKFFKLLEKKGYKEARINNARCIQGIKLCQT